MVSGTVALNLDKLPDAKSRIKDLAADLLSVGIHAWKDEVNHLVEDLPKHGRMYGMHQASAEGESWARDTGNLQRNLKIDKSQIRSQNPKATGGWKGESAVIALTLEFRMNRPTAIPALDKAKEEILKESAKIGRDLTYSGSQHPME